jgi:hypothetical protein
MVKSLLETAIDTEQPRYLAYMLRLWQVKSDGEQTWRASLEDAHTGERRGFANLDQLFGYLMAEMGERNPQTQASEDDLTPREIS